MQNRIVLVSDDSDFFEYISTKFSLRKSDELYRYGFDDIPDKLDWINQSLLIVNSENSRSKTLDLLNLISSAVCMVFSYNEEEEFLKDCYNSGMLSYVTVMTPEEEFQSKVNSALKVLKLIGQNVMYREMLVENKLVAQNNEVFLDYNKILDSELDKIKQNASQAVLLAISPNEKTKFLFQPNQIETLILSNIRKDDILMNYAPNKYFLLLKNTNVSDGEDIWTKIQKKFPEKIYAGIASATGIKNRSQLVSEALNKLHEAISRNECEPSSNEKNSNIKNENFKIFRKEFNKNFEKTIIPVFYQFEQKYNEKLFGVSIEHETGNGYGILSVKSRNVLGIFKITTPGFSKINFDIMYSSIKNKELISSKRITLEPEELEAGVIEDLMEQFIIEFRKEVENERIG